MAVVTSNTAKVHISARRNNNEVPLTHLVHKAINLARCLPNFVRIPIVPFLKSVSDTTLAYRRKVLIR
jgi:hypothetical protein